MLQHRRIADSWINSRTGSSRDRGIENEASRTPVQLFRERRTVMDGPPCFGPRYLHISRRGHLGIFSDRRGELVEEKESAGWQCAGIALINIKGTEFIAPLDLFYICDPRAPCSYVSFTFHFGSFILADHNTYRGVMRIFFACGVILWPRILDPRRVTGNHGTAGNECTDESRLLNHHRQLITRRE